MLTYVAKSSKFQCLLRPESESQNFGPTQTRYFALYGDKHYSCESVAVLCEICRVAEPISFLRPRHRLQSPAQKSRLQLLFSADLQLELYFSAPALTDLKTPTHPKTPGSATLQIFFSFAFEFNVEIRKLALLLPVIFILVTACSKFINYYLN